MSKRKPNSAHARMMRYSRAMLRTNHVAVLDLECSNLHTLINWKNATAITKSNSLGYWWGFKGRGINSQALTTPPQTPRVVQELVRRSALL